MADDDFSIDVDVDIQAQQVLLAAAHHDLETLRTLFRTTSANVQDPETGSSPLHTAIAACLEDQVAGVEQHVNGNSSLTGEVPEHESSAALLAAEKTLRLLFQNGAVWNELDANGETPGCLAWRLELRNLYDIVVDAGVRAELLLNRMDEFELLGDDDDSENDQGSTDNADDTTVVATEIRAPLTTNVEEQTETIPQITIEAPTPSLAAHNAAEHNATSFLTSELDFQDGRILDSSRAGVMMAWETDIMRRTAELLLPSSGLRVLNIGHGMGIIDGIFQSHGETKPNAHHIIEAHPQVLSRMLEKGWFDKEDVVVHEGRWQDVLPKLVAENVMFDAIYFDTFAEDYKAFREFFSEYVIGLLEPGGRWGFFHGLGADRRVVYDVYTKVVEMDLFEAGFDTEWENITVPDLEQSQEWQGVQRPYWALDVYRLPICRFID